MSHINYAKPPDFDITGMPGDSDDAKYDTDTAKHHASMI